MGLQSVSLDLRARFLARFGEIVGTGKLLRQITEVDDERRFECGGQLEGALGASRPFAGVAQVLRIGAGAVDLRIADVVGIADDDELEFGRRQKRAIEEGRAHQLITRPPRISNVAPVA